MGTKRAEQQIEIAAPPQACFDALVDYESMPDWQSTVKDAEVVERDPDARGLEVDWEIDAKVKTVRYRLRYDYEEPHRIGCTYVEGDVKDMEGEYVLEDRGDGTTLVTFSLELDPGTFVPGPVKKVLKDQVMRRSLEDLKRRVER